jgi:hypothetical protein
MLIRVNKKDYRGLLFDRLFSFGICSSLFSFLDTVNNNNNYLVSLFF